MTRKYKLERLQKHILLGFSGMTLASTIFFGGAQTNQDKEVTKELVTIESSSEIRDLNRAQKEGEKFFQKHLQHFQTD